MKPVVRLRSCGGGCPSPSQRQLVLSVRQLSATLRQLLLPERQLLSHLRSPSSSSACHPTFKQTALLGSMLLLTSQDIMPALTLISV